MPWLNTRQACFLTTEQSLPVAWLLPGSDGLTTCVVTSPGKARPRWRATARATASCAAHRHRPRCLLMAAGAGGGGVRETPVA